MSDLHLVSKPEGFDLRDKRSEKLNSASAWTPADAIYDASQRIQGREVTQLACYWWEKLEDGREVLKWAQATLSPAEHAYLLHKALDSLIRPPP